MKKYLLVFSIVFTSHCFAQVNFVINPSFENLSSCPSHFAQISRAIGWDTLRNGGGITPDLYNICYSGPYQYCSVPVNWWSNSNFLFPKIGVGYAGFTALYNTPQLREFIQGILENKLTMNNNYCVKAYFNLSDFSKYSINSLGFILDDGQVNCLPVHLPNITPQVFHTSYQLSDTSNWMRIEGVFTANGTEEYISIGNFFPDSLSSPFLFNPSGSIAAYYYIDDVSVINTNLPADAGNDTLIHPGDSVFIGRQPEIGLDEDCIWFVNGQPIDTIAGMWVKPDSSTTYVLEQTICGNVSWDTVTVTVDTMVGINKHSKLRKFDLYPNPNTGFMTLDYNLNSNECGLLTIYDISGRKISDYVLKNEQNFMIINEALLKNGIYYYNIFVNNELLKTDRVVIIK
jgi:hypothetical protein